MKQYIPLTLVVVFVVFACGLVVGNNWGKPETVVPFHTVGWEGTVEPDFQIICDNGLEVSLDRSMYMVEKREHLSLARINLEGLGSAELYFSRFTGDNVLKNFIWTDGLISKNTSCEAHLIIPQMEATDSFFAVVTVNEDMNLHTSSRDSQSFRIGTITGNGEKFQVYGSYIERGGDLDSDNIDVQHNADGSTVLKYALN
jgi:hypothetical protein